MYINICLHSSILIYDIFFLLQCILKNTNHLFFFFFFFFFKLLEKKNVSFLCGSRSPIFTKTQIPSDYAEPDEIVKHLDAKLPPPKENIPFNPFAPPSPTSLNGDMGMGGGGGGGMSMGMGMGGMGGKDPFDKFDLSFTSMMNCCGDLPASARPPSSLNSFSFSPMGIGGGSMNSSTKSAPPCDKRDATANDSTATTSSTAMAASSATSNAAAAEDDDMPPSLFDSPGLVAVKPPLILSSTKKEEKEERCGEKQSVAVDMSQLSLVSDESE
jgi:hypothetical protein